ncbi:hypothetical protein QCA50_001484 [Cerrena zonata]|uniref:Uncharacterized protein n=1 Tax=Cerrena zonata TaxID=2478898 RepID=A0AAW0GVZ4_9APHY
MCFEGNSAPLSDRYLNAQLSALWQNAVDCYKQDNSPVLDPPANENSKYTRALAQFHYVPQSEGNPGDATVPFYAEFDQPKVEYICENAALLFLVIKQGHVDLDKHTTWMSDFGRKKSIQDVQAVFWVEISRRSFKLEDSDPQPFKAVVLNMKSAKLLTLKRDNKELLGLDTGEALKFYLKEYLGFLESTNNNVLFDLPHFGAASYKPKTDCATSRHRPTRDYPVEHYPSDANVSHINQWFTLYWPKDTTRSQRNRFDIIFGTPQVDPLYKDEVIFTVNMSSISFVGLGHGEHAVIKDCEISFIVRVTEKQDSDDLVFDFGTSHRYTTYFPSSETHQRYVQDVINFVSGNICTLLEDLSMNVFPRDFEPETPPRPEFDEVIALPPSIMISYFSESRFPTSWERDGFSAILSISFQSPPPARQSSITHAQDDAAVIVAINIRTCSFPPRDRDTIGTKLDNVKIIVELSLEVKDHEDLPDNEQRFSDRLYQESFLDTRTERRHLRLRFDRLEAEKSYKLVSATSISDEEKDVLRKCMLEYVETHLREGRGIWYTIPISIPRDNPNGYLPEQLYFSGMDAPIIVVIGIRRYYGVPPGRLSPQDIERLMGPSGDRSRFSGSICLSSKILLQPLWAYINASTTLIPSTLVTLEDKGQMEFVTWKDRSGTSMEMTNFKHLDWEYDSSLSSNEHLKTAVLLYLFKQRDKQQLSLTSITNNRFEVFTSEDYSQLNVRCNGKSIVEFHITRNKSISWSEKSSARWSTSVSIGPDLELSQTERNSSIVPERRTKQIGSVELVDFNVFGTHSKLVEAFTKFQVEEVQQSLRHIVDHTCKAAGAKESDQRKFSFDSQHNLIVQFYSPAR